MPTKSLNRKMQKPGKCRLGWMNKLLLLTQRIIAMKSGHKLANFILNSSGFIIMLFTASLIYFIPYVWSVHEVILMESLVYVSFVIYLLIYIWLLSFEEIYKHHSISISKLCYLFIQITLIFASIYMWMMFWSSDRYFGIPYYYRILHSITPNTFDRFKYFLDVLRMLVDSVHFSIVTATTVGYGDISPKSHISKIVVDVQIIYTFWIVVIGIGKHSGDRVKIKKSGNKSTKDKQKGINSKRS